MSTAPCLAPRPDHVAAMGRQPKSAPIAQPPTMATLPAGNHRQRSRRIDVLTRDGVRLACEDYGDPTARRTIVFLHGLCLTAATWAPHIRRLIAHYGPAVRVIRYDHRGHGKSGSAPMSSYSIHQLADDFAHILAALNVSGPVTVVGHSMGGMTALAYLSRPTSQQPVDLTGLVLIGTSAGKLAERGLGRLLAAPGCAALLHLAARTPPHLLTQLIKPICATLAHLGERVAAKTLASVALTALTTTPPATALGFLPALRAYDLYPTLPTIRARTIIVSGDLDPLTPPAHSRDLAAAIPGAQHVSVSGAGHMLPQQAPAVIHRAICEAILGCTPGGSLPPGQPPGQSGCGATVIELPRRSTVPAGIP